MPRKKTIGGDKVIQRSVMTDQDTWFDAKAKAAKQGVNMSEVVVSLLKSWLRGDVEIQKDVEDKN